MENLGIDSSGRDLLLKYGSGRVLELLCSAGLSIHVRRFGRGACCRTVAFTMTIGM
ncbi:hypothetical protein D3C81_616150 [compost metagenome]